MEEPEAEQSQTGGILASINAGLVYTPNNPFGLTREDFDASKRAALATTRLALRRAVVRGANKPSIADFRAALADFLTSEGLPADGVAAVFASAEGGEKQSLSVFVRILMRHFALNPSQRGLADRAELIQVSAKYREAFAAVLAGGTAGEFFTQASTSWKQLAQQSTSVLSLITPELVKVRLDLTQCLAGRDGDATAKLDTISELAKANQDKAALEKEVRELKSDNELYRNKQKRFETEKRSAITSTAMSKNQAKTAANRLQRDLDDLQKRYDSLAAENETFRRALLAAPQPIEPEEEAEDAAPPAEPPAKAGDEEMTLALPPKDAKARVKIPRKKDQPPAAKLKEINYKTQYAALKLQLDQAQTEIAALRARLSAEVPPPAPPAADLPTDVAGLQKRVIELEGVRNELLETLRTQAANAEQLQRQLEQATASGSQVQVDVQPDQTLVMALNRTAAERDDLRTRIEESNVTIAGLQDRITALGLEKQALAQELAQVRAELGGSGQTNASLQAQLQAATQAQAELRIQLKTAQDERDAAKRDLETLNQRYIEASELEAKRAAAALKTQFEQGKAEFDNMVAEKNKEIGRVQTAAATAAQDQIVALNAAIKQKDEQIQRLLLPIKAEAVDREAGLAPAQTPAELVEQLRQQLALAQNNATAKELTLTGEKSKLDEQVRSLSAEQVTLREKITQQEASIRDKDAEIDRLTAVVGTEKLAGTRLQAQLTALQTEKTKIEASLADNVRLLGESNEKAKQLDQRLQQTNAELSTSRSEATRAAIQGSASITSALKTRNDALSKLQIEYGVLRAKCKQ